MRDRVLIFGGAFCRATAAGTLKVFLGFYLIAIGLTHGELGVVVSAGLAGVMLGTLTASFLGDRIGRRKSLILLLLINLGGMAGLYFLSDFASILIIGFLGMVNGMGKERGAAVALETAALPQTAPEQNRTKVFAWYNALIDIGQSVGSLLGGLPVVLRHRGMGMLESYRVMILVYCGLVILALLCVVLLTRKVELGEGVRRSKLSPESRKIVTGFAALSWLDSFGSGFIAGSIFSLWLSLRFGVAEDAVSLLFFCGNIANAISHFGAAWISRRIGLVNTMVFTHIPSNVFLMSLALAPDFAWAIGLYLARELLVEMDVPTRQSYLVGVVKPEERTAASGLVSVARNLGWACAPTLAGWTMSLFKGIATVSPAPVIIAGGLKIVYDLALWRSFRNVKPPEERKA